MFFDYWKIPLLSLPEMGNMVSQKIDGKTIFTDCWKVLVLNFLKMGNTVYFGKRVDGKMIFSDYWKILVLNLLEMETRSFLSQKVDGKMVFPWSFWTFHDIPGLGKFGFLCSAKDKLYQWKEKLSLLLARSEALFIIDDIIADENPNKQRQSLLELAISGGHRSH